MSTTGVNVEKETESLDLQVSGVGATADSTSEGAAEHADAVRSPSPENDDKIAFTTPATCKAAAGGQAVIDQREAIPTTGKRVPTSRWEYITFCIFCELRPRPFQHAMSSIADNFRLLPQWRP
jgi:hypothetical protein